MLADARRNDGLAFGQLIQKLDRHLGQDYLGRLAVQVIAHVLRFEHFLGDEIAKRGPRLPFRNLFVPGIEPLPDRALGNHLVQAAECKTNIAFDRQLHATILVVLGLIDVDMNDRSVLAEFVHLAGDAVVKPNAKGEEQIGAIGDFFCRGIWVRAMFEFAAHRPVGVGGSMHSQPAQGQRIGFWKSPATHDGRGHRNLGGFGESPQFLARIPGDESAAAIQHRTLRLLDQTDDLVQHEIVGTLVGMVSAQGDAGGPHWLGFLLLNVFGKINHHRSGSSALRHEKSLFNNARNIGDVRHQIAVFYDRQRHPEKIRLLEAAFADHRLRHLAGQRD